MSANYGTQSAHVGASANTAPLRTDHWYDHVNWWEDPRLAYAAGLAMGHAAGWREGYAACDAQLVAALTRALGGPDCGDYAEAVKVHHLHIDQKRQRDQFDRTARGQAA